MSFSILSSFALASLVLAIAPGPDNIFVLTQSALYGVKRGLAVILGLCLGIIIQTLCVIVGVSAFISAVPVLMIVIKLAGVLYLSYLAYQAIKVSLALSKQAQKKDYDTNEPDNKSDLPCDLSFSKLVYRGLIMNITNPKVQLFFLSFFPQFLPSSATGLTLAFYICVLGSIFALATLIIFSAVAIFSGTLSSYFKNPTFNIRLNYSAAFIFIALAIYTLKSIVF